MGGGGMGGMFGGGGGMLGGRDDESTRTQTAADLAAKRDPESARMVAGGLQDWTGTPQGRFQRRGQRPMDRTTSRDSGSRG